MYQAATVEWRPGNYCCFLWQSQGHSLEPWHVLARRAWHPRPSGISYVCDQPRIRRPWFSPCSGWRVGDACAMASNVSQTFRAWVCRTGETCGSLKLRPTGRVFPVSEIVRPASIPALHCSYFLAKDQQLRRRPGRPQGIIFHFIVRPHSNEHNYDTYLGTCA